MGASYRKITGIFGAFCLALSIVCGPLAAWAAMDYMPRLAPTSGWLIGQAALFDSADARGAPLPCVAFNQFENGFTVRLSGGGGRIAALAIDFRQNAFGRGERYPVRISVDRAYARDFEGSAFDPETLVIDTQGDESLFKALKSGEIMIVGFGGSVAAFDLKGLPDGLARLESCYRPNAPPLQAQMQPNRQQNQAPPGLRMIGEAGSSQSAPQSEVAASQKKQPPLRIDAAINLAAQSVENTQPAQQAPPAQAATAPEQPSATSPGIFWNAEKGEDIRTILSRWSQQAGVNLVWTTKQTGSAENDFQFNGNFVDAVHALLAQSGKNMLAQMQDENAHLSNNSKKQDAPPVPQNILARSSAQPPRDMDLIAPASGGDDFFPAATVQSEDQGLWTAAAGADLRDTLAQWSRRAGIDLIWQSPSVFSVPVDMSLGNGYESAVEEILKRSGTGTLRPVGELRRDAGSGRSALVIRVEGNS